MRKGEQTRAAILDAALELASRDGLEGLTIGLLAERMQMSKSGVFAHFGSREDLQVEVVREYHRRFEDEVFFPSLREPRGLPRLRAMMDRWMEKRIQEVTTGCIYISGAVEYDDRAASAVREQLVSSVTTWREALLRAIRQSKDEGHLKPDTDPQLMLFELYSFTLGLHHDARFLHLPEAVQLTRDALEKTIDSYQSPESTARVHSSIAASVGATATLASPQPDSR
ncbi:TetR/AcrR family transcriptional regulator [Caballeronia sp. LP006]|jgi:AcrR family transcriptional regulator|uniref:TetR/AcrR family transcriptional regulator n=1 Tax=unclassified Caballeronia TaxID=2646786 RepID=UPI001FD05F2C|nr:MULTISPECIES: TetR/AcrR family transcriptional regulator [unclassified Caballeronia]MDR5770477.1 TetR/AcrR family transcriptional regulator [Caballeronia sp. LZ002]MDR5803123.1 TetR/AcrR family transcriptional regulator [Caballeronia sp. LZ001]MDR5830223.1 TetR/AcrR family transcriptional regulator [Caballeronia sp. LP006]MDR5845914.1 TetR/AcrR family transcriptional regulator [Caballeronia sp. LZ003]